MKFCIYNKIGPLKSLPNFVRNYMILKTIRNSRNLRHCFSQNFQGLEKALDEFQETSKHYKDQHKA